MAARRSGLKGAAKFKRLLRSLPETAREELATELRQAGPKILSIARNETPQKTGASANALDFKVFPKTLRLQVGLLTKAVARRFFYLRILEGGRKEYTTRGRNAPRRIGAIPKDRYDIVRGRTRQAARAILRPILRASFDRALRRAASGGSNE
jgi:hypothetical protein